MQIAADLVCCRAYVNCGVVTYDVIGSEIASTSCELAVPVSLVEGSKTPLAGALGCVVSRVSASLQHTHRIDLRFGASVKRLEGDSSKHVRRVPLDEGGTIQANLVVVALGSMPNVGYASLFIQTHRPVTSQLSRPVPQAGEDAKGLLLNTHRSFQ